MGEMIDDEIQKFMNNEMSKALEAFKEIVRNDTNEELITLSDGSIIKRGDSIWRVD